MTSELPVHFSESSCRCVFSASVYFVLSVIFLSFFTSLCLVVILIDNMQCLYKYILSTCLTF